MIFYGTPEGRTEWKEFNPDLLRDPSYFKIGRRRPLRIMAEYVLEASDLGQTFKIAGKIQEKHRGKWRNIVEGDIPEEIGTHFQELEPYLKWDGMSYQGPTDYFTGGKFWWDLLIHPDKPQVKDHDPLRVFQSVIVFGALEHDELPPLDTSWGDVHRWLKGRLPWLILMFKKDMEKLFEKPLPGIMKWPYQEPREWYPDFPL